MVQETLAYKVINIISATAVLYNLVSTLGQRWANIVHATLPTLCQCLGYKIFDVLSTFRILKNKEVWSEKLMLTAVSWLILSSANCPQQNIIIKYKYLSKWPTIVLEKRRSNYVGRRSCHNVNLTIGTTLAQH